MALNLAQDRVKKLGVKSKRLLAGWNENYLRIWLQATLKFRCVYPMGRAREVKCAVLENCRVLKFKRQGVKSEEESVGARHLRAPAQLHHRAGALPASAGRVVTVTLLGMPLCRRP